MFMDTNRHPSEQPSARRTEEGDRFNRTLFAALDAIEAEQVPYAMIGGIAASGMGRPRSTHDIDIFVRPEDAESALRSLEKNGFKIERTDPVWLYKAWKEEILVDVIFKSSGDIYFDDEMNDHVRVIEFHGRKIHCVSPEDLIIIKSAVHNEVGPHHWHDALAILSHAVIDWDYLLKRARRAPRRLLALLIYAQSNDILVPNRIIFELFNTVFAEINLTENLNVASKTQPQAKPQGVSHAPMPGQKIIHKVAEPQTPPHPHAHKTWAYMVAKIKEALAEDERVGDQNLKIVVGDQHVLVRGEVMNEAQKQAIAEVIQEAAPGYKVDNQLKVPVFSGPEGAEYIV